MAKQSDVWGAFAWTAFAFNTLFSTLFAILGWFTFHVSFPLIWLPADALVKVLQSGTRSSAHPELELFTCTANNLQGFS